MDKDLQIKTKMLIKQYPNLTDVDDYYTKWNSKINEHLLKIREKNDHEALVKINKKLDNWKQRLSK